MIKLKILSGRIGFIILIFSGVIIIWGVYYFLTPHENLKNPININNQYFTKNFLDTHPDLKNNKVKTFILTSKKVSQNTLWFVNGELNPTVSINPGEIQRWRLANASGNTFFNLVIPGITFQIVARDGNVTTIPVSVTEELLSPNDTVEILVQGPGWGKYHIVTKNILNGEEEKIMVLRSEGLPALNSKIPENLVPNYDLKNMKSINSRNFIFTKLNNKLLVNGLPMDDGYMINNALPSERNEEWILTNSTNEFIPFSLPYNFQVVEINENPIERYGYDKTFSVPPNGKVIIKIGNT